MMVERERERGDDGVQFESVKKGNYEIQREEFGGSLKSKP